MSDSRRLVKVMVHLLNRLFDDLVGGGKFLILLNEKARTFPANIHNIGNRKKELLYTLKMLTGNVGGRIIRCFSFPPCIFYKHLQ